MLRPVKDGLDLRAPGYISLPVTVYLTTLDRLALLPMKDIKNIYVVRCLIIWTNQHLRNIVGKQARKFNFLTHPFILWYYEMSNRYMGSLVDPIR